ncbi:MAG: hypothetical protein NTY01_23255 [Verrucomicrobia bacterium]|nr:hypothetical protein [Verrucomicrobiota bacterium]
MSASDPLEMLRRHERTTRMIFAAFGVAAVLTGLVTLTVDAWWPQRQRLALKDDRFLAGTLFAFGAFNILVSAAVRLLLPMFLRGRTDMAGLASAAMGCTVLSLALCETPVLFGLIYVLAGGDTQPAAFFTGFALTCMVGHYVARIRP